MVVRVWEGGQWVRGYRALSAREALSADPACSTLRLRNLQCFHDKFGENEQKQQKKLGKHLKCTPKSWA